MTRVKYREWTNIELEMIRDVSYSCKELSILLNARIGTIRSKRKVLGVKSSSSAAMTGKERPQRYKREIRCCTGTGCSTTFEVNRASKKKYCSPRCQMLTQNPSYRGMPRPIRNPNIEEYTRYARKVHGLSQKIYEQYKTIINPNNYPRTLCGVNGGWQLDHVIPIKECFEKGISIEDAASLSNLRMLPWKDNLMRNFR